MAPFFLKYNELPSTHDHAIDLVSKTNPNEGTVIVAANQTAGRGRFDRSWSSEPGHNALLSCILHPGHLLASQAFHLNIAACLAVSDLLQSFRIPTPVMKWPNDVLVHHQKIAGILIQNQFSGKRVSSSVVSVGLNVNQTDWPESVSATSMKSLLKKDFDCLEMAELWVSGFFERMGHTKSYQGMEANKQEWLETLHGFQELMPYEDSKGRKFYATLTDMSSDGQIILIENGRKQLYHMDEVRYFGHQNQSVS